MALSFLRRILQNAVTMPLWAHRGADGFVTVDVDIAYPVYLAELSKQDPDLFGRPTQYGAEVARRVLTDQMIRRFGKPLNIRLHSGTGAWRLATLPEGRPGGGDAGANEWVGWSANCRSMI